MYDRILCRQVQIFINHTLHDAARDARLQQFEHARHTLSETLLVDSIIRRDILRS